MLKLRYTKKNADRIFIFVTLLFPIVQVAVFYFYLNFSSFFLAFRNVFGDWSLANFTKFFEELGKSNYILIALRNTFIAIVAACLITLPLNLFASYLMFKKFYGHMFFRIMLYFPAIMGITVTIFMSYIFDANGPIIRLGSALGVKWSKDILQLGLLGNLSTAYPVMLIIGTVVVSGGDILLYTNFLSRVPRDVIDSGRVDGLGVFGEFRYMVVPLLWQIISLKLVLSFALGFGGGYESVALMTAGRQNTQNFGYYLTHQSLQSVDGTGSGYGYPAAIGMMLTFIIAPLTLFFRWLVGRAVEPVEY